jgi:hypothetical protein
MVQMNFVRNAGWLDQRTFEIGAQFIPYAARKGEPFLLTPLYRRRVLKTVMKPLCFTWKIPDSFL